MSRARDIWFGGMNKNFVAFFISFGKNKLSVKLFL